MDKNEDTRFPQDFLKLENIVLWDSKLERHAEYQAGRHAGHLRAQSRQGFEAEVFDAESADGENVQLFRVKVKLGLRAIATADEDEALHTVEATFAVEYRILAPLPQDKMKDFITFNCAHNVWPFWREHVFSTLRAAGLPILVVPFFPGKKEEAAKAKPKKSKKLKSQ